MQTKQFVALAVIGVFFSCPALAGVVIYNYTPALPTFQLSSLSPADHQELDATPSSVTAVFSLAVDTSQSSIKVFDPYNNLVAGKASSPRDNTLVYTISQHLLAGPYRVEWTATCTCQGNPGISGVLLGPIATAVNGVALGGHPAFNGSNRNTNPQGSPIISGTTYFTVH